ncbi:MAG: hypothetical protein A2Y15_08630 [Clostridiales bacterium GWF2_36_10]|nr:MAG: hypothetical protein A2Y15_08630 [Clostridiales bacterium GWF2_36_10]HAN20409.1 hypothetical protein [Clostridiales bacterium]
MKVLTLWQPYATALVLGIKKVETRSWATNYRGELYIHAAAKSYKEIIKIIGSEKAKQLTEYLSRQSNYKSIKELPYGAIIGKVEIIDCKQQFLIMDKWPEINSLEINWGDYSDYQRFAWRIANPVVFDNPISIKGMQGLWNWEGDTDGEF